jgi:hypothetical protein
VKGYTPEEGTRGLAYRTGYEAGRRMLDESTFSHYRRADAPQRLREAVPGIVEELVRRRGDANLDAVREGVIDGIEGRQPGW